MSEKPILFSAPMVKAILAGTKTVTRRLVKAEHCPVSVEPYDTPNVTMIQADGTPLRQWLRFSEKTSALIEWVRPGSHTKPTPRRLRWSAGRQARHEDGQKWTADEASGLCPYGTPGDSLWVREAWTAWFRDDVAGQLDWKLTAKADRTEKNCTGIAYRATTGDDLSIGRWVTPLFMPRWASRITLDVVSVRVERLHDITPEDADREGVAHWWDSLTHEESKSIGNLWTDIAIAHGWEKTAPDYRGLFGALWSKINGRESWTSNPWVWRVEFARS